MCILCGLICRRPADLIWAGAKDKTMRTEICLPKVGTLQLVDLSTSAVAVNVFAACLRSSRFTSPVIVTDKSTRQSAKAR